MGRLGHRSPGLGLDLRHGEHRDHRQPGVLRELRNKSVGALSDLGKIEDQLGGKPVPKSASSAAHTEIGSPVVVT